MIFFLMGYIQLFFSTVIVEYVGRFIGTKGRVIIAHPKSAFFCFVLFLFFALLAYNWFTMVC